MPAESWDALRRQTRDYAEQRGHAGCIDQPFPNPFTYFEADVTIDGNVLRRVGVRKKGNYGSLSYARPSLKIKFHEYVDGQSWSGMKRLTLNNNQQDGAYIRQCLAYGVFAAAGVPVPRCNFAKISVNGRPLGVYSNVESLRKPWIRRHFESDEGNLYEGNVSDFSDGFMNTWQQKTNRKADSSQGDLAAVQQALASASPDRLEAELEKLINLPAFYRFWATEVVIASRDSFSAKLNNFYIYGDPADRGLFTFIPWGTDRTFSFKRGNWPQSVVAISPLQKRLYALGSTRERYYEALDYVLDEAWNEQALIAEADRMHALIKPLLGPGEDIQRFEKRHEVIRQFIRARRGMIGKERAAGEVVLPVKERALVCGRSSPSG